MPVQYRHNSVQDSPSTGTQYQVLTWALILALTMGSAVAGLVIGLYLKTLREKRASQVRLLRYTDSLQYWCSYFQANLIYIC